MGLHSQVRAGSISLNEYKRRMRVLAKETRKFFEESAQITMEVFLEKLQKATPVKTGRLRNGWKASLENYGQTFKMKISNSVYYMPFVEYGHKARDGSWIAGRYMVYKTTKNFERSLDGYFSENLDWITSLDLTKKGNRSFRSRMGRDFEKGYV